MIYNKYSKKDKILYLSYDIRLIEILQKKKPTDKNIKQRKVVGIIIFFFSPASVKINREYKNSKVILNIKTQ